MERPICSSATCKATGADAAGCAEVMHRLLCDTAPSAERPDLWLEAANAELIKRGQRSTLFTTAVAVLLEPANRCMTWAFAGHLPPHRLDAGLPLDGAVPGAPLGVQPQVGCTSHSTRLAEGAGVLLYTDGLEDARGPGGDRFGVARINHALSSAPKGLPPAEIVERLRTAVCRFAGDQLLDDVCMVAVRAY